VIQKRSRITPELTGEQKINLELKDDEKQPSIETG
jgi:hypothetical protein